MQVSSERIARLHSRVSGVQCGALTEIAADVRLRDKELQKIIHEMDAQHASEIEAKQRRIDELERQTLLHQERSRRGEWSLERHGISENDGGGGGAPPASTGACGYNRPCAHQYVGKYQSCMV